MRALPDEDGVLAFLGRVRTRLLVLRAMEGLAAGLAVAAVAVVAGLRPDSTAVMAALLAIALLGALVHVLYGDELQPGWWRLPAAIAGRVEREAPQCRNLVVTAAELAHDSTRSSAYVRTVVARRAAGVVQGLETRRLFPARNATIALVAGAGLLAAGIARPAALAERRPAAAARAKAPSLGRVEVTVLPPGYSGLARATLVNPSSVEALAASRIRVRVEASADSVMLETLDGTQVLAASDGSFTTEVVADADGFLAFEPRDAAGNRGSRRLIGLLVTPDRPPRITLESPGRDLFFATVPDTLPVVVEAEDDLAVASLRLRYTAVSGSGERFTFTEQDVPMRVDDRNPRSWAGRGTWQVGQLGLTPGDLVVYRAIATDRRPGAPPVESESYVLEVVTPGAIAAEGFAADDERDRYAVSQQMVILRTERLLAARSRMTADSVADAARRLAAEQRQVRAEFVFMMGGELEDEALETAGTLELNEVAEAEAEGDILAGRLANQGRIDMTRAIRSMSRASAALNEASLDQALRDERAALDNLMRAFARSRFLLRALTQRERIDLARRMTGTLAMTAGITGPVAVAPLAERPAALRSLLAAVASMASTDSTGGVAARAEAAALALLRHDPSSEPVRRVVSRVQALTGGGANVAAVDSLVHELAAMLRANLAPAPHLRAPPAAAALEGALRDAMTRSGSRP